MGTEYKGTMSMTVSGEECQDWNPQDQDDPVNITT